MSCLLLTVQTKLDLAKFDLMISSELDVDFLLIVT